MNAGVKRVCYAQERPYSWVGPAVQTLRREQFPLTEVPGPGTLPVWIWARTLGERLARNEWDGTVIFCVDAGLVACVLNKIPAVRAVAVTTVPQAALATLTLGANVLVVEMPGRTYYEVRQIVRELCLTTLPCPEGVAATLKELDGHAHC